MEAAHYPPSGGPHAGAPSYNGALSMNDPSYRREQYPQRAMADQQGYNMYPPAPQVPSSQAQPSYQPPQQLQNTQPPQDPQQGNTQSGQQFNPELKQEEDQGDQGAMIGQTPDGTGPNALLPLVSNPMGTAPKGPQEIPPSFSMIELGRRYTLEVVQQPQRARMCGFGDKDRRPITPPPCIRLVITDIATGVEVDVNDIEYGLFVLNVDLWSEDGTKEVNLVRHSTASPAISSTIPTSFMQAQAGDSNVSFNPLPHPTGLPSIVREPQYPYHHYPPSQQQQQPSGGYNEYPGHQSGNGKGYGQYPNSQYQQQQQQPPPYGGYSPASMQQQPRRPSSKDHGIPSREVANHHVFYHTGSTLHAVAANAPRPQNHDLGTPQHYDQYARMGSIVPTPTPQGMYTRNLIGSLSASAFRLADTNEKIGIWFVLQDLSVRTEGNFRLRFSFCNVGIPSKTPNGNPANQMSIINTGRAPILASCYSEPFTVYSAKKFPGVVESTPLSKKFATQGIKIPIRKDGAPKKSRGGDDGEEFDD